MKQIHVVSRGMVKCGLIMLKYFSVGCVDWLMIMASKLVYGNPTKYGIIKPAEGPMAMKIKYGKYPVIDRGTVHKIKSGQIQVLLCNTSRSREKISPRFSYRNRDEEYITKIV